MSKNCQFTLFCNNNQQSTYKNIFSTFMIFTWHARLIFYELNTQTHYWDTFRIVVLVLCMCSNKLVQSDRYLLLPRLTFQHIFDMFLFQAACEIHTILVLTFPNFLVIISVLLFRFYKKNS